MNKGVKIIVVGFVCLILFMVAMNLSRIPILLVALIRPEAQFTLSDPLFVVSALLGLGMLVGGAYVTYRVGKIVYRYGDDEES